MGPAQRTLKRADSVVDNDAMLEVEDENLLTPEESPTHEQQQWETIETMVFNGNESTLVRREPETITLSDIVELKETWVDRCWACLEGLVKCITCSRRPIRSMEIFKNTACVFNQVDMWSRRLFPLSFLMINFLYWSFYVY